MTVLVTITPFSDLVYGCFTLKDLVSFSSTVVFSPKAGAFARILCLCSISTLGVSPQSWLDPHVEGIGVTTSEFGGHALQGK